MKYSLWHYGLAAWLLSVAIVPAVADDVSGLERAELPSDESGIRGVLEPFLKAEISSQIEASVLELPFREGESFRKGDTLVKLDCSLHQARLNEMTAGEDAARFQLDSDRQMAQLNSIGTLELRLSEVRLRQASTQVALARLQVDRCIIKAPFAGRVVKPLINRHESVVANTKLLQIVSSDTPEIRLVVPSKWAVGLSTKTAFEFRVDETGEVIPARVKQIGAHIDAVSQMVPVVATIDRHDKPLWPGMSGTAQFAGRP